MWSYASGRGHQMQWRPTGKLGAGFAASIVATAILAASAIAPANAAGERALFVATGGSSRAPIGWVEFCNEYARECETRPTEARDVVLTPKAWKDLLRINKWVNDTIKPI